MTGRRWESTAWAVAGVVVLLGMVITIIGLLTPVSPGWFAYQPLAAATFAPESEAVVVSRVTAVGCAVLALGLVALAFTAGWLLAKRQTA